MANIDNPNGFKVYQCSWPSVPTFREILKSGVTVAKGDAIIWGTDGYLDIATASSASIAGVSDEALTGDGSKYLKFTPTLPGILWEAQCSGTGAQTDIGETVDIEGTTGIMEINENANSVNVFRPIGKRPDSAYGANVRLYGVFVLTPWF